MKRQDTTIAFEFFYWLMVISRHRVWGAIVTVFTLLALLSIFIPSLPFHWYYVLYVIVYFIALVATTSFALIYYDSDKLYDLYSEEYKQKLKAAIRDVKEDEK